MSRYRYFLAGIALFFAGACSLVPRQWTRSTDFDRGDLDDENPVVQIKAIQQVVEAWDEKAIPDLIDLLTDADAPVRTEAFRALSKLAGDDAPVTDYEPYANPEIRNHSAEIWKNWWNARKVDRPERERGRSINGKIAR